MGWVMQWLRMVLWAVGVKHATGDMHELWTRRIHICVFCIGSALLGAIEIGNLHISIHLTVNQHLVDFIWYAP
jgi:hypothetical protein